MLVRCQAFTLSARPRRFHIFLCVRISVIDYLRFKIKMNHSKKPSGRSISCLGLVRVVVVIQSLLRPDDGKGDTLGDHLVGLSEAYSVRILLGKSSVPAVKRLKSLT